MKLVVNLGEVQLALRNAAFSVILAIFTACLNDYGRGSFLEVTYCCRNWEDKERHILYKKNSNDFIPMATKWILLYIATFDITPAVFTCLDNIGFLSSQSFFIMLSSLIMFRY